MLKPEWLWLDFLPNGLTKTIAIDIVFYIIREHYRFRAGTQRLHLGDRHD